MTKGMIEYEKFIISGGSLSITASKIEFILLAS